MPGSDGDEEVGLRARLKSRRTVRAAFNARTIARAHRAEALRRPLQTLRFLATTPEVSNWTYELENADELIAQAAAALGSPVAGLLDYARELQDDEALRARLRVGLATRRDRSPEPRYGKRTITYAVVRAIGPSIIAETGTHDGLGSAIIAEALRRNAGDGRPGHLHTFDINPRAGWLMNDADRELVTAHTGPTSETLPGALSAGVDLFIHDSLRTDENERHEYDVALESARGTRLIVLCDDLRTTDVLSGLCRERGVPLTHLKERPARHWWGGNELGLAVMPMAHHGASDRGSPTS